MEYVEGATLRERLDAGPLPADVVAAVAMDLAEALHAVNDYGVVHRDVKPSNILLARSPLPDRPFRAKLTDFGIACLVDATRITTPGTVIGTAAYLAPEQVRGEPPTGAADIYSLGLVLLEALTGRRAFPDALGHEALVARLTATPAVPEGLPAGWRELLARMTALRPAQRPTALEVMAAAQALRTGEPLPPSVVAVPRGNHLRTEEQTAPLTPTVATTPAEPPPMARRRGGLRRWAIGAAAATAVAGAAGIGLTVGSAIPAPAPAAPTSPVLPFDPAGLAALMVPADSGAAASEDGGAEDLDPASDTGASVKDDARPVNDNRGPGNNNGSGPNSNSGNGPGKNNGNGPGKNSGNGAPGNG